MFTTIVVVALIALFGYSFQIAEQNFLFGKILGYRRNSGIKLYIDDKRCLHASENNYHEIFMAGPSVNYVLNKLNKAGVTLPIKNWDGSDIVEEAPLGA